LSWLLKKIDAAVGPFARTLRTRAGHLAPIDELRTRPAELNRRILT
jgi:hypothetical protein